MSLFITSFPFALGYSLFLYFSGFVYGFPLGFIPAYLGSVTGALFCFILFRYVFHDWAHSKLQSSTSFAISLFRALNSVIKIRAFRLMTLLRLLFTPYSLTSAILAVMNVRLSDFMAATAIGQFKILLHVYIGSSINVLTDVDSSKSHKNLTLIVSSLSAFIMILLSYWTWIQVKEELDRTQDLEIGPTYIDDRQTDNYKTEEDNGIYDDEIEEEEINIASNNCNNVNGNLNNIEMSSLIKRKTNSPV